VVNHFLRNKKFHELEEKFKKAAIELSVEYEILTNMECMQVYTPFFNSNEKLRLPDDGNPVLFWDKDIILAKALEKKGHRVYNSADAIAACDNKILTSCLLNGHGIDMPVTVPAPMTYSNVGFNDTSYLSFVEEKLGFPVVVKEAYGSFGAQVYLANNNNELQELVSKISPEHLYQQYIDTSCGRDLRLQVVGETIVAAMYRYSVTDFRANITNGGLMKAYEPDDEQCEIAIKAAKVLGLDFAGVDLLFGENEKPMICEVNSNAHFKNLDDCTGSDIAKDIIMYINKEEATK